MKNLLQSIFGRYDRPAKQPLNRHFHLPVDEMSIARLHDALAPFVEANANLRSFEPVRELMWVDNSHPPVRPLIAFEKMKGGSLWPVYGLSVDFVPVIARQRAIMRTGKNAVKFDIKIDPRDHLFSISFFHGAAAALQDMEVTLPVVLERAIPFWMEHQTVTSLADAVHFEEKHTNSIPGLGVENYIQAGFARPFLLAASGKSEQALESWRELWSEWEECSILDKTGRAKAQDHFDRVIGESGFSDPPA